MQAFDILAGIGCGQQGLRTGVVVGIVERLHRHLQQQFVAGLAGAAASVVDIGRVGNEREGHRSRQARHRQRRAGGADAEAGEDDRDARCVRIGVFADRLGVKLQRTLAVRRDARERVALHRLGQTAAGRTGRRAGVVPGPLSTIFFRSPLVPSMMVMVRSSSGKVLSGLVTGLVRRFVRILAVALARPFMVTSCRLPTTAGVRCRAAE